MERPHAAPFIDGQSPAVGMDVGFAAAAFKTSASKKEKQESRVMGKSTREPEMSSLPFKLCASKDRRHVDDHSPK